jgi:predicted nucleotidyltransferase component of viral defense system
MLYTKTVSEELLELLNKIMIDDIFNDFVLVGGTALALQIGHRNSIDIDLFGNCEIDEDKFISKIVKFGEFEVLKRSKNILISSINKVKTDFVNYKYPLIDDIVLIDGIRFASKKDIVAMKLNAIVGRGTKKDFIDFFYLLNEFSLNEIISFYEKKYNDGSVFMAVKSLTYFSDADLQITPTMFDENFNWEHCKQKIIEEVCKL